MTELTKPCPYCGQAIPDSGVFGLPTYTDVPENHAQDCPIREVMEKATAGNLKLQYRHISFVAVEDKPKAWRCYNHHSCTYDTLGFVKWYGPWGQYSYFPTTQTVYSKECLADIADFISQIPEQS